MDSKNNKGVIALLIVIIVILATLCVLFATGTLSFNTNKENDDNSISNQNINDENDTSDDKYTNWMNYILEQNITNITIEKHIYTGMGDSYNKEQVSITREQLENIFAKLANYNLIKKYYLATGYPKGDILSISYDINGISYNLQIANGEIWEAESLDDLKLRDAFYYSIHSTINENLVDEYALLDVVVHYNYLFDGYNNLIFNEYFK